MVLQVTDRLNGKNDDNDNDIALRGKTKQYKFQSSNLKNAMYNPKIVLMSIKPKKLDIASYIFLMVGGQTISEI